MPLAGGIGDGSGVPNLAKPAEPFPVQPREYSGGGQSSSGIITVMTGRGSSMSRGPYMAMSLIRRGARLSLRT